MRTHKSSYEQLQVSRDLSERLNSAEVPHMAIWWAGLEGGLGTRLLVLVPRPHSIAEVSAKVIRRTTMAAHQQVDWLTLLRSKRKLDRERGIMQLKEILNTDILEEGEKNRLESTIFGLLSSPPSEERHGGLMAATLLIPWASEQFCERVKGEIPSLLENEEFRIRLATGRVRSVAKGGPGGARARGGQGPPPPPLFCGYAPTSRLIHV